MIYIFKKNKLLQYCSKHRNERETQLWACAPPVSGLITGVNEGMEAEPCLSDALSLSLFGLCSSAGTERYWQSGPETYFCCRLND